MHTYIFVYEGTWALSLQAKSVAGDIVAHTKKYLTLFVRVCLPFVLALFDLIFLFDLLWAFCDFLHKN